MNPAMEELAIQTVCRLGHEKKEVEVIRLIMKNSIEERLMELQQRGSSSSLGKSRQVLAVQAVPSSSSSSAVLASLAVLGKSRQV